VCYRKNRRRYRKRRMINEGKKATQKLQEGEASQKTFENYFPEL